VIKNIIKKPKKSTLRILRNGMIENNIKVKIKKNIGGIKEKRLKTQISSLNNARDITKKIQKIRIPKYALLINLIRFSTKPF